MLVLVIDLKPTRYENEEENEDKDDMATKEETGAELSWGPANLAFIEGLYEDYLREPSSLPPDWQRFFAEQANGEARFSKPRLGPSFRPASIFNPPSGQEKSCPRAVISRVPHCKTAFTF
jgi:hypothetical protein